MDTQPPLRPRARTRAEATRRRRGNRRIRQRLVAAGAAGALLLTTGAVLAVDTATAPADEAQTVSWRGWVRQHLPYQRRSVVAVRTAPPATSSTTVPGPPATSGTSRTGASTTASGTAAPGAVPGTVPTTLPTTGPTALPVPSDSRPGLEPPGSTVTATTRATPTDLPTVITRTSAGQTTSSAVPTANPGGTGSTSSATRSSTSGTNTAPPATIPTSSAPAPTSGRRGLWNAIGRTPTAAELTAAPSMYGVVVLNVWETGALQRLKQLDPSVVVLAYQDLSSARSYDNGPTPPAGVTWAQATANPNWLATDASGRRIEWSGYPGHWQTAVWDPGYQAAWTAGVTQRVTAAGFDGVLADNALSTLHWYSSQLLAGTSSSEATDSKLRAGIQSLVETAGPALQAKGKILVPNLSDARLYPGRWATHAKWGGAMEENFAHFGTGSDLSSYVTDWGSDGWEGQAATLAQPGLSLAITRAAAGDQKALRYGYASLLVRGDGDSFWQPSADSGSYAAPQWIPEQRWLTGQARSSGTKVGGAWVRSYDGVWAAVNPTNSTVTLTPPTGATDVVGASVRTVQLGPASGVVLRIP